MSWKTTSKIAPPAWVSTAVDAIRSLESGKSALSLPWGSPSIPPFEARVPAIDRIAQAKATEALLKGFVHKLTTAADLYVLAHDNLAANTHIVGMNAASGELSDRGRNPLASDTDLGVSSVDTYSGVGAVVENLSKYTNKRGPFQLWVNEFASAFTDGGDGQRPSNDPSAEICGVIYTVEGADPFEVFKRMESLKYLTGIIPAPPEWSLGSVPAVSWDDIRRGFDPAKVTDEGSWGIPPDFRKLSITEYIPYLQDLKEWASREQLEASALLEGAFKAKVSASTLDNVGAVSADILQQIQIYLASAAELSVSRLIIPRVPNVQALVQTLLDESATRPDPFEVVASGGAPVDIGEVISANRAHELMEQFPFFKALALENYFIAGVGLFGDPDIFEMFFGDLSDGDWDGTEGPQGPFVLERPSPPYVTSPGTLTKDTRGPYPIPTAEKGGQISSSVMSRSFGQVLSFSKGAGKGAMYPKNTAQVGQAPDGTFLPYVGPGFYPEQVSWSPHTLTGIDHTAYPLDLAGGPFSSALTVGFNLGTGSSSHGGGVLSTSGSAPLASGDLIVERIGGKPVGTAFVRQTYGSEVTLYGTLHAHPSSTFSAISQYPTVQRDYIVAPHQTLSARVRGSYLAYGAAASTLSGAYRGFDFGGVTRELSLAPSTRDPLSGYFSPPPPTTGWPIAQVGQFPREPDPIAEELPPGVPPSGTWAVPSTSFRGGDPDRDLGTLTFQSYTYGVTVLGNSEAGVPLPFLDPDSGGFAESVLGGVRTSHTMSSVWDGAQVTLDPSDFTELTLTLTDYGPEENRVVSLHGVPAGPAAPAVPADTGLTNAYAHGGHCPPEAGGGGNKSAASWLEIDFPELAPALNAEDCLASGVEVSTHVVGDWDTSCIVYATDQAAATLLDSLNHRVLYVGLGAFMLLERRVSQDSPGKLEYELVAHLDLKSSITEKVTPDLKVWVKVDLEGELGTFGVSLGSREETYSFVPLEPFRGYGPRNTSVLIGASPRRVALLKKTPEMYLDFPGVGDIRISPGAPPLLLRSHRCLRGS